MRIKCLLALVCFVILGLAVCTASNAADKSKVGYINLQRLVNESKMGKVARQDIQKLHLGSEPS